MRVPLLDLEAQYRRIREPVEAALLEVVRSQRFILGPPVERLEGELAERVGVPHAIACASGTDALLLSIAALDPEPETEVIVPSFTFFATAGAVWNAGAVPVFADIDPATFNLTADTIEAAVTPRTRAVVVVHLFGQMAPMEEILRVAERHDLMVVEDAAQAIDAAQEIGGERRFAGSVGDLGCFSFFPAKNLGGFGDGGLITTRDGVLADRLRKLRVHGGRQMYHHEMVGTNSRLDAIQAAVLSAKLPYLDEWTEARRSNAAAYTDGLEGLESVRTPVVAPENRHVFNQYTIRVERRDDLKRHLEEVGIGSSIYYPVPLHLQQCFSELGHERGDLPESEQAAEEVLSIPVHPELTEDQRATVIDAIRAGAGLGSG